MNKPNDIREILELYDFGELSALEAKQAITSLIKELVAEARIDELTLLADFQMGDITVMGRNERSWRDRISELEQELDKL